ncbi:Voltage-dependent calcium channel subunit alpha-2/delta-4 [Varanus komodoensis]|nr:Voltage-dependent calcium channel subunit alpha-2/delta-4 [Varanus komodoensis]
MYLMSSKLYSNSTVKELRSWYDFVAWNSEPGSYLIHVLEHLPVIHTLKGCYFFWRIHGNIYVLSLTHISIFSPSYFFFLPIAVGVQIKLELLQRKFWMTTQQCSAVDGLCPLNCQDDNLNCFLIDNNGFILVSKVSKQTGKFFGEVDGSVMAQLINMGMFREVKMFDYQAMCKTPHHHHSGARPLLSPVYVLLAAVKWLITDFLIFLLEFNISSFWHTDNLADAKSVFHHAHKHKKHDTLQPCDTEYPIFVYEPAIKETNGIIECKDCQKYDTFPYPK